MVGETLSAARSHLPTNNYGILGFVIDPTTGVVNFIFALVTYTTDSTISIMCFDDTAKGLLDNCGT